MEFAHRVAPGFGGLVHQVQGAEAHERRPFSLVTALGVPARLETLRPTQAAHSQALLGFLPFALLGRIELLFGQMGTRVQPLGEARDGGQGAEGFERRHFLDQFLRHPLDQEIAQRHPFEARLAIADGIKNRRLEAFGVAHRGLFVDEARHVFGDARHQGHLDKNQRLAGQLGMEKSEATAIRLQAATQVVPAVDGVHRFVRDDFFEQLRGGVPGDLVQLQKAGIEPGAEQMVHVRVGGAKSRMVLEIGQQRLAHFQNRARPTGRPVHPAQQLLAGWLHRLEQMDQADLVAFGVVAVGRIHHQGRVGVELAGQEMEKVDLATLVQMLVMVDQLDGHALRIGLTPGAEQFFGAELGRIELLVLNETFQHERPFETHWMRSASICTP